MENTKNILLRIFAVIAVLLIIYAIITGSLVKKIGLSGIFDVEFDTTNATPIFRSNNNEPNAQVKDVWNEFDVTNNNVSGLVIHINFEINNFKDNRGEVVAVFFDDSANPLLATDGQTDNMTADGQIAVGKPIKPGYEITKYEDFQIFVPYQLFSLGSGKHTIKFFVVVRDDQNPKELARSNWDLFWIENP